MGAAAAVIGGIASGFQTVGNWFTGKKNRESQEKQNQLEREWNREMYEVQRRAALKDRDYDNQYNHPAQQMERLRQAGLNPHLVYGKGADMAAASTRDAKPGSLKQEAPHMPPIQGLDGIVSEFMDLKQKQALTDNIHARTATEEATATYRDLQSAGLVVGNARSKFDLDLATQLRDTTVESALLRNLKDKTSIDKTIADTQFTIDENQRQKLANSYNIAKTVQETLSIALRNEREPLVRKQLELAIRAAGQENLVRELDVRLSKLGLTRNDPYYIRAMIMGLTQAGGINQRTPAKDTLEESFRKRTFSPTQKF